MKRVIRIRSTAYFTRLAFPMIAISIPLFLIAPLVRGSWKIPLSLLTAGWICQVLGHIIEGKPPEFLKDWRFLLVGLRWIFDRSRASAELNLLFHSILGARMIPKHSHGRSP